MDDDGTGWHDALVGAWDDDLRDAVVARVEALTRGWWGTLVRVVRDPDGVPGDWTETLHRVVLTAVRDETGADLDELGSQAVWARYDEVWDELTSRWREGGQLDRVALGAEAPVVALLQGLPPGAAAAAGADVRGDVPDPLWVGGRLRIDVDGLLALLDHPDHGLAPADVLRAETLVATVR
ncbi:hypothetical protein FTX61_12550 [Nitriliruptoraceae bacterium ZYF776]|nr:hypothetical protein [Profundirhabdus halotolerans]